MHISSSLYSALRIVCAAFCAVLCVAAALPAAAAETPQEILAPSWFKPTFLDFPEDVREAAAAKKHLMIFITQNGCPWCKKLVEVNFRDKTIVARMQKELDSVEINLHGSSETVWIDGTRATEKALAARLKVRATPTLMFLDERGAAVLRLNLIPTVWHLSPAIRFTVHGVRPLVLPHYLAPPSH